MPNDALTPRPRPELSPLGPPGFRAFEDARADYLRRFTPRPQPDPAAPRRDRDGERGTSSG